MASPSYLRAILYAIGGFATWVLADACMKLAGEAALPPYEVIGFLGIFTFVLMLAKAAGGTEGGIKSLWPKNPRAQLLRAALALGSNFFNAIALKHLSLTLFYVTVFTAPMMIALLAALFLRERMTWQKILAIAVGFMGVVIAIKPGGAGGGDWAGYAAAISSTLCFAVNSVWLRVMTQSESNDSLVFCTGILEMIFGVIAMGLLDAAALTPGLAFILSAMSLLTIAGNVLNFTALRTGPAAVIMQFHYTQIVTGALVGYLIWQEVPALHTVLGAVVIIGSGLFMARHAQQAEKA